ncbi:MAG: sigma 54-interacting transcriptional regulator [Myxococcota bacterium]|nr:sigma 54-interacting transcriptional regulator [Myxococcota bacterium]
MQTAVRMQQLPTCMGRQAELERLLACCEAVENGTRRLVLVEGPTGSGKRALTSALRARLRLRGGVVLEGRCEAGRPLHAVAQIVERALAFLSEVGASPGADVEALACAKGCHALWYEHREAGPCDGSVLPPGGTPIAGSGEHFAARRARMLEGVAALLDRVASLRAPIVLLDGLQRADSGTLELVRVLLDGATLPPGELGRSGRAAGLCIVATVATDEPPAVAEVLDALRGYRCTERVPLGPLSAQSLREWLHSQDVVERLLQRTGGMPGAIMALLDGHAPTPAERAARCLATLEPAARALVEAAAVLAHPADPEVLARVAGLPPDPCAIRAALDSGLLRRVDDGSGGVAVDEAMGGAVRDGIDAARVRDLHVAAARVLAEQAGAELEVARHWLAAGRPREAIEPALVAARTLAARHAAGDAAKWLDEVRAALEPDVPDVLLELACELYAAAGDYRRAIAAARRLEESGSAAAVSVRLRTGRLLVLAGQFEQAAVELQRARAAARAEGVCTDEIEIWLAELEYQRGRFDDARGWVDAVLGRLARGVEPRIELRARNTLGKLALAQLDADGAVSMFEQNLEIARAAGLASFEAQALINLGVAHLRRRDLEASRRAFEQALDVATRVGDVRERAIATENLAVLAHLERDYARAHELYRQALSALGRLGHRPMLARVAVNLGELYETLGELARARAMCDLASHVGGAELTGPIAAELLLLRGRIEAAEGATAAARASFEAARAAYRALGERRKGDALLELVRVALADGDLARARALLAELAELPDLTARREAELAIVRTELKRAEGEPSDALARRALELAEACGDDELVQIASVRLARVLLEAGRPVAAARALERAQAVEARLRARVPPELVEAHAERRAALEMRAVEQALAAACGRVSSRPARPASDPPTAATLGDPRRREDGPSRGHPEIVGRSPAMRAVLAAIERIAPTDALVLVRGESGTGKELVAEALHRGSARRDGPLVKVNCAALVETLLLSELFGHERGAFTGAHTRRKGRFELADGGTLFLDEIGDISPKTQVALLRVLQERAFERVGGTQSIRVDVRIVAATHRDLEAMVRAGTFREDLYYRLRGVTLDLPPLRERLEDLPALCEALLARIAAERGETPRRLSREALERLSRHRWPGNVRELENVLRSATLFAEGPVLEVKDFAGLLPACDERGSAAPVGLGVSEGRIEDLLYAHVRSGGRSLFDVRKDLERECIARALRDAGGNITRAAALLGLKRPRLSQLVKEHGLGGRAGGTGGAS